MANNRTRYTFIEFIDNYSIRIPLIQRDYIQGRESSDKKKLEKRQEFIRLLLNSLKNGKAYHVDFIYGSPVQNQRTGTGKQFFIPLDGQQRLTTLFLLHWILINKSARNDTEKSELLKRISGFSYETRLSSAAFCIKLTSNIFDQLPCGKVRETFSECPWYSSDWDFDPTISNMVSMLEAMNTMLEEYNVSDIDAMLNNILSPSKSITFDLLDMKEYALTDSLYIKMNARGKELTDFEHWKALFIQLLEDNYRNEDFRAKFTDKVEHEWANLFWDYVKNNPEEYPTIDNCFMSFFHYLTNLQYYSVVYPHQDEQKDYFGTIEQINNVYRNHDCVTLLFNSLDFLSVVGKKDSNFFDEIFKNNNDDVNDNRIRLFSNGRTNLFQRCILPQENEDFDIYEKTLLYALLLYCTKLNINTVTRELKQYIRVVRNFLLNTNQFVQAQVNLISNLRLNEFNSYNRILELLSAQNDVSNALSETITGLGGKNAAIIEKEKLMIPNRSLVCWLEDMTFCRGNIRAFMSMISLIPEEVLIKRISLFNNASDEDKIKILIAAGYKGISVGWCKYGTRLFFGKEGRWDVLFSRDAEKVGKALQSFVVMDSSIEEYIIQNIPKNHDFRYYSLKYEEFIKSRGYWQNQNDSNSYYYFAVQNELDDLDMISLKAYTRSPLLAYHTEPFASTVLWELVERYPKIFGNGKLQNCSIHREKAQLVFYTKEESKKAFSLFLQDKKWYIKDVGSIPSELIDKYNIEDNCLTERNGKDLIDIALDFVIDFVQLIG